MAYLKNMGLLFVGIMLTGSLSFGLETSLKPLFPLPKLSIKMGAINSESKTLRIVRDGGIGMGAGALSGLSFIVLTQGNLPHGTRRFDNEALTTGLLVGLIGGVISGVWETKHDPIFANSN